MFFFKSNFLKMKKIIKMSTIVERKKKKIKKE
jgi:hypothetical protein